VQRPQADVVRRPPRTNDVDLDERRYIIPAARKGHPTSTRRDDPRPRSVTSTDLDKC
jgi:hypothetical protein